MNTNAIDSVNTAARLAGLYESASRAELDAVRAQRLRELVTYAREHSPFYAERLNQMDLEAPDLLRRLPTLDKATMLANLSQILTDQRLRDVDLAAHVDGLTGDELLFGEYRVMASGGTSGVRGFYVYDQAAWAEAAASLGAAALILGVPPREPRVRAATIWAAGAAHMSFRMAASVSSSAYERLSLSAMASLSGMVASLNDFQPEWLSSYPSIAALLAEEQIAGRLRISPRVVMTTSEQCTPGMRARIADAWGAEPFNTYSSTEGGGMAIECDHHGGMHVFESQVVLEVVDEDGEPVPDGEPGAKVLVTNLFNRTQPLIRFELTDMLTLGPGRCSCGRPTRRIVAIDGRSDDIMRLPDGHGIDVPVHPNHFAEAVESVAEVNAYQVVQADDGIDVAIVASEDITEAVAARIRTNLTSLGAAHTPIRVTRVDYIARPDGASGKFKLVQARLGGGGR